MSRTVLIGKAKELFVATLLVGKHLHVYFPLVDNGFDLLVASDDGKRFLPVQVKYKSSRSGFALKRADAAKFVECDAVLAFGSDSATEDAFYFFPAKAWWTKVDDRGRGDDKVVLYSAGNKEWLEQFKGDRGITVAFQSLLAEP